MPFFQAFSVAHIVETSYHARQIKPNRPALSRRKTILVLYYTRGVYPLRNTIETHLYAPKRYSKHRTIYINIALGFPWEYLRTMNIDVIIFHTSFCGMRWSRSVFFKFTALIRDMADYPALKIAMPQDEFIHTDLLCKIINDLNVDVVLSCADQSQWPIIYDKVDRASLTFQTVLPGYLDEKIVKRVKKYHKPLADRKWWISYRAWRAAFWLGEHGTHKVRVGEEFAKASEQRDLPISISLNDGDTISGMDWFRFLADSRAVVGVEGGASVIDRDGKLKDTVDAYLETNPEADFETVKRECFPTHEGSLSLKTISPRHLEAAATKTCQLLVEGEYNGVLKPGRHYISIKSDYSNIADVMNDLADDAFVQKIVDRAYHDIIKKGHLTYRGFVANIDGNYVSSLPAKKLKVSDIFKGQVLNFRDWMNWRIIQIEVAYHKNPNRFRRLKRFAGPIYRLLVQPL